MSHANPPVTPVASSKSAALSRVLNSVPRGYTFYTTGECPFEKTEALARKFHERYAIGCSPAQRITRKQKGLANALLVLFYPPERDAEAEAHEGAHRSSDSASGSDANPEATLATTLEVGLSAGTDACSLSAESPRSAIVGVGKVSWLLLVTEGTGAVREQERLRSVLDSPRLHWLGYELVRHATRGKTSWTWRRTKQEMAELYALLASQLNRRQMTPVQQTLLRISRQPGFSGVREQSWALCQFARCQGYAGELPFLCFIQKIKHGEPLWLT